MQIDDRDDGIIIKEIFLKWQLSTDAVGVRLINTKLVLVYTRAFHILHWGHILVGWLECRFWMQRQTVRTPAAVCCFLEQDTLSALLQPTQL